MRKKVKISALINQVRQKSGLTTDNLKSYTAKHSTLSDTPKDDVDDDAFDLLCLVNAQKVRVPFSLRNIGEPIAIFPFKDEPDYIELQQYNGVTHANVNPKYLPNVKFCERVYAIKDQLNKYLLALDKPILKGAYLADHSHMPGCGWIVMFNDNETGNLSSDFYGGNRVAQLRYVGKFKNS
jgi:hypothetical protein